MQLQQRTVQVPADKYIIKGECGSIYSIKTVKHILEWRILSPYKFLEYFQLNKIKRVNIKSHMIYTLKWIRPTGLTTQMTQIILWQV